MKRTLYFGNEAYLSTQKKRLVLLLVELSYNLKANHNNYHSARGKGVVEPSYNLFTSFYFIHRSSSVGCASCESESQLLCKI